METSHGAFVRLVSGTGDVDKLEAGIGAARSKALALLKTLKSFRAMIVTVDRGAARSFAAGITPDNVRVEIFEASVGSCSRP